jgi:alginate O-acetyltransferase complex protein AlgI
MVFSSTAFLFLFLPLTLGLYFFARSESRNAVLVVASVAYYAWGEPSFVPIVLASVALNYAFGLLAGRFQSGRPARLLLPLAVVANIGLLAYYKYANFFAENANRALTSLPGHHKPIVLAPIALPLGISFFTFHALSYVIDIHRRSVPAQKNPLKLALYILFFPQLVAGPIVRYHEIADQLTTRRVSRADFATGVQRFVVGLGKKVLIANPIAEVVDGIFGLQGNEMTCRLAWLGAGAYALQIYFDFSGYSDMAIGLARLFGFHFPENFRYPYVSRTITEFWRRWHMSLSNWFRDYLYIPLGGNRVSAVRLYANLVTVFFLCGLWHGASWNFVVWGLLHGAFLVLERAGWLRVVDRAWPPLRHAYCLVVVAVTWVFFRASTLSGAETILAAMVGRGRGSGLTYTPSFFVDSQRGIALAAGLVGSAPFLPWLKRMWRPRDSVARDAGWEVVRVAGLCLVFAAAALRLSAGTYNPFIYFRF